MSPHKAMATTNIHAHRIATIPDNLSNGRQAARSRISALINAPTINEKHTKEATIDAEKSASNDISESLPVNPNEHIAIQNAIALTGLTWIPEEGRTSLASDKFLLCDEKADTTD